MSNDNIDMITQNYTASSTTLLEAMRDNNANQINKRRMSLHVVYIEFTDG